ncbi:MAG TPA: cytochrome c family protein [Alphaproteobacteria bacterium]
MKQSLVVLAVAAALVSAGSASADDKAQQGAAIFKRQCGACHTVEPGKNRVGPSLADVYGRKSGSVQGFNYSPAMKKADVVWNEENLSKYLADPKGFIPDNRMAFAGLKKEDDREAVIEYLESVKKGAGAS